MTIQELNNLLSEELKSYIKKKDYVSSGKLLRSIKFTCQDKGELDISFTAENYILYLEDGKLLQNFFDTSRAVELLTIYEISKIEDKINS